MATKIIGPVYKLGKKPARKGAVSFKFADYFDATALPTPPKTFGSYNKYTGWGMFLNDKLGDCVCAGAGNETKNWGFEGGQSISMDDDNISAMYTAVTGFNPNAPLDSKGENPTDNGTDMQQAADYRRSNGLVDAKGIAHKIDAYVSIDVGNWDEIVLAMYLFGGAGIGIQFPRSAMTQFNQNVPWDVVHGAKIDGGHYIPGFGVNPAGNIVVVSWGRTQEMTRAFFERYNDESIAYLDISRLKNQISPEGFNYAALKNDLASISQAPDSMFETVLGGERKDSKFLAFLR